MTTGKRKGKDYELGLEMGRRIGISQGKREARKGMIKIEDVIRMINNLIIEYPLLIDEAYYGGDLKKDIIKFKQSLKELGEN